MVKHSLKRPLKYSCPLQNIISCRGAITRQGRIINIVDILNGKQKRNVGQWTERPVVFWRIILRPKCWSEYEMTSKKETGNINAKLNKSSTNFSLLGKEYSLFDNNHKTISCLSLYLSLSVFYPRLSVRPAPPSCDGSVRQQLALCSAWRPGRPLLPVPAEAGRKPLGVQLQVGYSHLYNK